MARLHCGQVSTDDLLGLALQFCRADLQDLAILGRLWRVPGSHVEGLTGREDFLVVSVADHDPALNKCPQCGHWQRSSGNPLSNGARFIAGNCA
jgi:hypothetical protein